MARRRHCENKSYNNAIGSSLRFVGAVKKPQSEILKKCLCFPLHITEDGDDIVVYYMDDMANDDLRLLAKHEHQIGGDIANRKNIRKNMAVWLADVLPEHLPLQHGKTFEEIFEESLRSTERDEDGMGYGSRKVGANYCKDDEEPAIVRTYSINEYRTNGYF